MFCPVLLSTIKIIPSNKKWTYCPWPSVSCPAQNGFSSLLNQSHSVCSLNKKRQQRCFPQDNKDFIRNSQTEQTASQRVARFCWVWHQTDVKYGLEMVRVSSCSTGTTCSRVFWKTEWHKWHSDVFLILTAVNCELGPFSKNQLPASSRSHTVNVSCIITTWTLPCRQYNRTYLP